MWRLHPGWPIWGLKLAQLLGEPMGLWRQSAAVAREILATAEEGRRPNYQPVVAAMARVLLAEALLGDLRFEEAREAALGARSGAPGTPWVSERAERVLARCLDLERRAGSPEALRPRPARAGAASARAGRRALRRGGLSAGVRVLPAQRRGPPLRGPGEPAPRTARGGARARARGPRGRGGALAAALRSPRARAGAREPRASARGRSTSTAARGRSRSGGRRCAPRRPRRSGASRPRRRFPTRRRSSGRERREFWYSKYRTRTALPVQSPTFSSPSTEGAIRQQLRGRWSLKLAPGACFGDFHTTMHSLSPSMRGASDEGNEKRA